MRFKIRRTHLASMDVSVLVELLAMPIGEIARRASTTEVDAYTANPRLSRAQVNVYIIGDAVGEVLNGGLFQLIMNSTGDSLLDLPGAFSTLGCAKEAKIFDTVCKMFPDDATRRVRSKRVKFASAEIVPGGWDGQASGQETALSRRLDELENQFVELVQSAPFFRAVSRYVQKESDSFEIVD